MPEYTPTTTEARALYVTGTPRDISVTEGNAEFERWLATHDAEVLASRDAEVNVLREQLMAAEAVIAEALNAMTLRTLYPKLDVIHSILHSRRELTLAEHDREVAARTLEPIRAAEAEWRRTPMDPRTEERDWVKADIHFRNKVLAALRSGTEAETGDNR